MKEQERAESGASKQRFVLAASQIRRLLTENLTVGAGYIDAEQVVFAEKKLAGEALTGLFASEVRVVQPVAVIVQPVAMIARLVEEARASTAGQGAHLV